MKNFIFLLFLILIPLVQGTPERATLCVPCHTNLGVDVYQNDNECGDCHNYLNTDFSLNIPLFEAQHNPNLCGRCHNVYDRNSYHQTHANVSCEKCHGSDVAIPEVSRTNCAGCHGAKVHDIHQNKLNQVCSTCHGSPPNSKPTSDSVSSKVDTTAQIYAKVVNYKQYTLYEVLKRILSSINI